MRFQSTQTKPDFNYDVIALLCEIVAYRFTVSGYFSHMYLTYAVARASDSRPCSCFREWPSFSLFRQIWLSNGKRMRETERLAEINKER